MKHRVAIAIFAALISTVQAFDIRGRVETVSGQTATIAIEEDVLPSAGDKVAIYFLIAGTETEVSVATATVTAANRTVVTAKIDNATGTVEKGHLVRIHSTPAPAKTSSPTPSPERSTPGPTATGSAYTPKSGSAERDAIMDAMRLDFYPGDPAAAHRNANGVLFEVVFLKVDGDWACTFVRPAKKGGGELAQPRWGLLRRKAGQWSALDYMEALRPFPSEEAAQDALGMNPSTVARLRQLYPQAPAAIFPEPRR